MEMAAVMQNYARATGFSVPVIRSQFSFADHESMGSEGNAAVIAMQKAGVMMGDFIVLIGSLTLK